MSGATVLEAAAWRIVQIVRTSSPGVPDSLLAQALFVAAGICLADAVFPDFPATAVASECGKLAVSGMQIGREARTKTEKESCQGAA